MINVPIPVILTLAALAAFLLLGFIAWRRYLWASGPVPGEPGDTCPFSLADRFGGDHLVNATHQQGALWLPDLFSRTAKKFPGLTALHIPHTGESLNYAELDRRAEEIACAIAPHLDGPDRVVAVAMPQDNWQIVASHLAVLRAGGTLMFLDTSLPDTLVTHMLDDARPALVLTRGEKNFRGLPTLDVLALPGGLPPRQPPEWLDDPARRLATLFYTSGTTGKPKGVECPHAGYVNLAFSYADYFDLIPGMDATTLTSSLGYDGSIPELYSAWVSGCAVVLLTGEQLRSGPGLLPVLREAEVTVLFCPPVLLTTLTANPELDLPYPICRYVVPAGEAFPASLVEPWTRGRRQVINTYGPTEASTDTSRQSLQPGEPVTIGSPFANVTYVILEEGGLTPLPHGETGELCIGGVHLAKGYRNLPELTARQFIEHPRFGRLYRTGDRCRIDIERQQVHFLGRIDAQLKVRGHRVETQAVEDILQNRFEEIEAAVLDYQNGELVAFVRAPSLFEANTEDAVPAPADWCARTLATLARQLPPPSVPGRIFLVGRFAMKPVSGKIDRERLPRPGRELNAAGPPASAAPAPADEEVLGICREVFESPLGWDDVFADHGGHSIVIARLAQRLHAAGRSVSVRDLLGGCNTARKVAAHRRQAAGGFGPPPRGARPETIEKHRDEAAARVLSPARFSLLQALFLVLLYSPPLAIFLGLVAFTEIGAFFMTASIGDFLLAGLIAYMAALAVPFAGLLWVMLLKLLMGGHPYRNRTAPGSYPKWSRMHLRVWCIERLQGSVLRPLGVLFRSAPLVAYALRRLGARVGANLQCAHDAEFSGPLDQLSIGDDVTIQSGAWVHTVRWAGQQLQIGSIRLEGGAKIGMRAGVAGGVTVGRDSRIRPFTPVLRDVGPGEMWEGAPARFSGRCVPLRRTSQLCEPGRPAWRVEALNILMQVFLDFWLVVAPTAVVTWFAATFIPVPDYMGSGEYFSRAPLPDILWQMSLFSFTTTWFTTVLVSVAACLFIRFTAARPGLYPTRSLRACLLLYRVKKLNQVQGFWTWTLTGQYLRALAGMRFPRLGASECDLMFNLVPELARADSQVFWSNGCFTSMLDCEAGHTRLRQLDMPRNFFSGNNCVAEYGQYPSNFLLGVSTPANDIRFRRQMRSRPGRPVTIAGNPPVKFASTLSEGDIRARTRPGLLLFLGRLLLHDVIGIGMLRVQGLLIYVLFFTTLLRLGWHPVLGAFIALVFSEIMLVLLSALAKKLLVGKNWGSDHTAPFWSWRHFRYFFAQDCFFNWCRRPLRHTAGTLYANIILRRMGCRIGKRTIVASPMQASDWNAVDFGDDCLVNGFLQFHTFEGWLLKVKRTRVGNGCSINFGATVMGGARIGPGTTVMPLSLVLKQMELPSGTWEGSPAELKE